MSNILVDPGTTGAATAVATDAVGTVNYQIVKLDTGAAGASSPFTGTILQVSNLGTLPNIPGGTINLTSTVSTVSSLTNGSIVVTAGTFALSSPGTITSGTVSVNTPGTITSGSISIIAGTIGAGTINTIGTLTNLANGTIQSSGTTTGVGVVTTVTNLSNGTIQNSGTVTGVGVVSNLTNGSVAVTAGTIRNDGRPSRNILSFGTTFGGTAAGYGTMVGSATVGAGTSLWVNDLSIINSGGGILQAMVGFGTALNGTSVLAKGSYGASGGIQKSYPLAVNAGMTNFDLVCYIGAAGTIDVNVSYFISA